MYLFGDVVVDDEDAGFFDGENEAVEAGAADDGGVGERSAELDVAGENGDVCGGAALVCVVLTLQRCLHRHCCKQSCWAEK